MIGYGNIQNLTKYACSKWPFHIFPFLFARIVWFGMAGDGRRAGVHTGFRTIILVLYIGSLPNLDTWFPFRRGRTMYILGSLCQRSRSPLL